jgi:hypothetical protein
VLANIETALQSLACISSTFRVVFLLYILFLLFGLTREFLLGNASTLSFRYT